MGEVLPGYEFDKPREECGVFGIFAPGEDVVSLAYLGGEGLQHRGQDAAGIAVNDDSRITLVKDTGLVSEVFTPTQLATLHDGELPPHIASVHTRWSTSEGDDAKSFGCTMPILREPIEHEPFALSANGNFLLHNEDTDGAESDTTYFADRVAESCLDGLAPEDALAKNLNRFEGAASLVVQTKDRLIAARDRHGYRPLELGALRSGGYVVASETSALDIVGAQHIREIYPGEILTIDENGLSSTIFAEQDKKVCAFEFAYNALPSSQIEGVSVNQVRRQMGVLLAQQSPVEADLVIGVPDSGTPAARGYSNQSGLPFEDGLQKNRYITRTFIKENQIVRERAVALKFRPLRDIIEGQRLVVIDDSIIRGTTARAIGRLLYTAGAEEVHFRSASPEYKYPCYYGMDTGRPDELLANRMSKEEMAAYLEVDSVDFLSLENFIGAIGIGPDNLSLACMNGEYHTDIPQETRVLLEQTQ